MTKIFFIGDTHFGKPYSYLKNYELYISERNLDVINNCEKIINKAIQEKADLVIFLGDLYERHSISPTIRRIVREKIFIPLNENNINTIIIGGNHDSIRNPKRGTDIQELANFPNIDVYTKIKSKIIENNGTKIGFIFLPYIHFNVLVEMAKDKNLVGKDILGKDNYIIAQHIFENFIKQIYEKKLKDCDKTVLLGHYYLDGAKIRETNNPSMIYGEFKFNKQMIQRQYFNLVIFGHVHLKQTMWNDERIVIPGSIDRIDMGERDSDKYYCIYNVEDDDLQFKPVDTRKLIKKEIEIPDDADNLTAYILDTLPEKDKVKDAVCEITIFYPKGQEIKIDKSQLDNYFIDSFYTKIIYTEKSGIELKKLRETNLDPRNLYIDFLDKNYLDHKYYADLKRIGLDLIEKEVASIDLTAKGPISIKSIDMQNFTNYGKGPNKIIFDKDLYVIKGPTGSGKSSILDAITFALYKRNSRKDVGLNLDEILYPKGYVNLELLVGDKILAVNRRNLSPKLKIKLDGDMLYHGLSIPEKEQKLVEIIGYDYDGFNSSFFIRQQELQIFSSLQSKERHERLVKLFKLKIFQDVDRTLKMRIDKLESEDKTLKGQIQALSAIVDELPQNEEKLKTKSEKFKEKQQEKVSLSKKVQELKEKVESNQKDAFDYSSKKQSIEEIMAELEKKEKELDDYKEEQSKYNILQDKLDEFKDIVKEKEKLEEQKTKLETKIHEKDLIQSEIESNKEMRTRTEKQYEKQLERLESQIEVQENRLSKLDVTMTKDDAFNTLKDNGKLTERLNRLKNVEIPMAQEFNDKKRILEFKSLEKKTHNELESIKPKEKQISKDIFLSDELSTSKNDLEIHFIDIENKKGLELQELEKKLKKLNKRLEEKELGENFSNQLDIIHTKLKEIKAEEQKKERLESKLKKKKDYSLLIENSEKELTTKNKKLQTLNKKFKDLEPAYQKYLEFGKEFAQKEKKLKEIENLIEGLKVEIDYIKKEITKIKNTEKKVKQTKKQIKEIEDNIEKYTILRKEIFHLNGVPKYAIEQLLPAISVRASGILNDLTNGKYNQITFKPLKGTRVGFEIVVNDGERDREASSFSGGEKTQINAAIRFAIMERIAEIPDTTGAIFRKSNTLFIDEGDLGTLDDETARQRFIDKILELKSMFKKIILITHLEDVAEQFPNRIMIGWDKLGKSKIIH